MSNPTVAVLIAFVVAAVAGWMLHAFFLWRARRERIRLAWDRFDALTEGERRRWFGVRFGPAIDAAQQRNAKPAPRVSDPNEHRGSRS